MVVPKNHLMIHTKGADEKQLSVIFQSFYSKFVDAWLCQQGLSEEELEYVKQRLTEEVKNEV